MPPKESKRFWGKNGQDLGNLSFAFSAVPWMHPTYLTDTVGRGMTSRGIVAYLITTADSCTDSPSTVELGLEVLNRWHGWFSWEEKPDHCSWWNLATLSTSFSISAFYSLQSGSGRSSWGGCECRKLSQTCRVAGVRTDGRSPPYPQTLFKPAGWAAANSCTPLLSDLS